MIHPSYVELMKVVNDDVEIGEEPVVNSRYSIVCATAKRARQLIDSSEPLIAERRAYGRKPLSIAVDEMNEGKLKLLSAEEALTEQERLDEVTQKAKELRVLVDEKRAREAELAPAEKPKRGRKASAPKEEAPAPKEKTPAPEEEVKAVEEQKKAEEKADSQASAATEEAVSDVTGATSEDV